MFRQVSLGTRVNDIEDAVTAILEVDERESCLGLSVGPDIESYCDRLLELLYTLEFDWLKQFWLHGALHARLQTFWHHRMEGLEQYYFRIEEKVRTLISSLPSLAQPPVEQESSRAWITVARSLCKGLRRIEEGRERWEVQVYCNSVFLAQAEEQRPLEWPNSKTRLALPFSNRALLAWLDGYIKHISLELDAEGIGRAAPLRVEARAARTAAPGTKPEKRPRTGLAE